jgi:hypothetical protein
MWSNSRPHWPLWICPERQSIFRCHWGCCDEVPEMETSPLSPSFAASQFREGASDRRSSYICPHRQGTGNKVETMHNWYPLLLPGEDLYLLSKWRPVRLKNFLDFILTLSLLTPHANQGSLLILSYLASSNVLDTFHHLSPWIYSTQN